MFQILWDKIYAVVNAFITRIQLYRYGLEMTSVLYSAGLNYQGSNPLRTEIRGIRNEVEELRKLIIKQADVINGLNTRLLVTEKALKTANVSSTGSVPATSPSNTVLPNSG